MPRGTNRESKKPEIIKLLREGKRPSEIARITGVSLAYVSQVKKEFEKRNFQTEGELEATVFKLFKEGKSPVDVVIELKIPAEKVEELYEKYLDLCELPPVTASDVIERISSKLQRARGEIAKAVEEKIRKFNEENAQEIKQLKESRNAIFGVLKEVSTLLAYLAVKEAITIASIPIEHPKKHVDVEFLKRTLELFTAVNPNPKDIKALEEYLKIHRDVLQASNNTKGAEMIDELLMLLTRR